MPGCLTNALQTIYYYPNILIIRVPLLFSESFIPWWIYRLHSPPSLCFVGLKKQSPPSLISQLALHFTEPHGWSSTLLKYSFTDEASLSKLSNGFEYHFSIDVTSNSQGLSWGLWKSWFFRLGKFCCSSNTSRFPNGITSGVKYDSFSGTGRRRNTQSNLKCL